MFSKILIFSLWSVIVSKQEATCEMFRNGSLIIEYELYNKSFEVFRENDLDVSFDDNGNKIFGRITWLNDCDFIIKYDENLNQLSEDMININQRGGLLVKMLYIEENCMISKMKVHDEVGDGQIIRTCLKIVDN